MKFKTTIQKHNTSSHYIIIPSPILKHEVEKFNEGDLVEVEIKKIPLKEILTIPCPDCKNIFNAEESDVYDCPICGREILAHEVEVVVE